MKENEIKEFVGMFSEFFEGVLKQAPRLVFQDYQKVNQIGITLEKFRREQEDGPDLDIASVDRFSEAMKEKLLKKRQQGRSGWNRCSAEDLSRMLREHVDKGDPVDVANFCMMLHQNQQSIVPVEGK